MSKRETPQYLVLGEILRPHGIRGELRMRVLTDYPERLAEMDYVYLGVDPTSRKIRQVALEHVRMHKAYALLKIKEVNDRSRAEILRGLFVMVHVDDAIPLEDDEVYLYQLIGMNVITDTGEALGAITDIIETGANDVYVVNGPRYGEVLIPITDETLIETDPDAERITVRLPDGLLPSL